MMDGMRDVIAVALVALPVITFFVGYVLGQRHADMENLAEREQDMLEQARVQERKAAAQRAAGAAADATIRGGRVQ